MADKLTLDRHHMKNRATAHLRIYVGGLTDNATVEELYDLFSPYGQVNGIIVNRNFGFIQFEAESSVQEAITKADGTVYQGKSLNIRPAMADKREQPKAEVIIRSDLPPAVALTDSLPNEEGEDCYDNYGNFIGDNNFREDEGFEPDEGYNDRWESRGGGRGRGGPRGGPRGRGVRGRGGAPPPAFRERSPVGGRGEWPERGGGFERYPRPLPEYPRAVPVSERNDCEIIVVSKALTEYAEYIEGRLKRLGIVVDLLFPMEDVPIGKVLGNIASRGCLYAILVMPQNQENRSMTLTILHGLPQEHRNMPLEDALQLLSRNFQEVQRGGPSGREAVYALLGQLADGRTLTVLQYDKVMEYLQERREQQVKVELGEPLPANSKTQVDLQQRIMSILNDKKVAQLPSPAVPPTPPTQNKLLNDPTVRKALDSILQKFT